MRTKVRLTESQLNRVILESAKKLIKEAWCDPAYPELMKKMECNKAWNDFEDGNYADVDSNPIRNQGCYWDKRKHDWHDEMPEDYEDRVYNDFSMGSRGRNAMKCLRQLERGEEPRKFW